MTTYEEWRVSGRFSADIGEKDEPYEFTWSPHGHVRYDDPEGSARAFLALAGSKAWGWTDGPHLHKHTVTVTDWEEIEGV